MKKKKFHSNNKNYNIWLIITHITNKIAFKFPERLMKKLGADALPFTFKMPPNAPPSVTIQPASGEEGKPCGVEYYVKIFVGEGEEDKAHKRLVWTNHYRTRKKIVIRRYIYTRNSQYIVDWWKVYRLQDIRYVDMKFHRWMNFNR